MVSLNIYQFEENQLSTTLLERISYKQFFYKGVSASKRTSLKKKPF